MRALLVGYRNLTKEEEEEVNLGGGGQLVLIGLVVELEGLLILEWLLQVLRQL